MLRQRRPAVVLAPDGSVVVEHVHETFMWLPEGRPATTPALAAHVAGLRAGTDGVEVSAVAALRAAHVAERAGDTRRAIALCEAVLALDPWRPGAWAIRGWARLRDGDHERAEADLRLGAALCHDALERSWCELGLGRVAEARGARREALRRYTRAEEAWRCTARTCAAAWPP